ncbi:MAG TPA: response regulator transcription factor [Pedococcus sp.]|nr:response regulator transcription factor [Pedococcus sp.]
MGSSNGRNGAIGVIIVRNETRLFSEVLSEALKAEAGVRLMSRPLGRQEAIDFCGSKRPDVILVEGTDASPRSLRSLIRPIKQACEAPVVLVVDEKMNDSFLVAGVEAGASGIVDSSGGIGQILQAVRAAAAGERAVDSSRLLEAVEGAARLREGERSRTELLGLLSEREREILAELDRGLRNSDIAERLRISPRTVEKHVHNILAKLQVSSRLAAVALAREMGDSVYRPMRGTA